MRCTTSVAVADPEPAVAAVFEARGHAAPESRLDQLVFQRLQRLGIRPANSCSDGVFLRRAYLDATGTLPSPEEASQFLLDRAPGKRAALVERLLEREEFADYWAMKWSDLLRVKAEFPINLWPNAAQAYHRWIRNGIRENKSYDRFARELLTSSGSNFRQPPVNFYRAMQSKTPEGIAQAVALTFMGVRAEKWPKARLAQMAAFFSQVAYKETREWKEEIVFFDPDKARSPDLVFPDDTRARIAASQDPREGFAAWLTAPANPWFARAAVNRIWNWLLGRGIVHEPDDIRADNPPANPELLEYLEREFVASAFDLKHIYRQILNSRTYQLSFIPQSAHADTGKYFAAYPLRRLDAELLIDALCQITGTTESYTSAIPEPYTVMPEGERAVRLPDGSITSSFLELFGRPPRDSGLDAERNNRVAAAQRLHLLNSSHVQRKIEQSPKIQGLLRRTTNPRAAVNGLYLLILSRFPAEQEWKTISEHSQAGGINGRDAVIDLAWALLNSTEFVFRH
jgi:hypothetical protein